jgi:spore maturation protein CgeB
MRLLLVYPGASFSTIDVAHGYHSAFSKVEGLELFSFQFEKYLAYNSYAQKFLMGKDYDQNEAIKSAAKDILVRILECRPDQVLFISGIAFPAFVWEYVRQLQNDLKHPFKTSVFLTEAPYVTAWEKGILERVQCAFVTDSGILDEYREVNKRLFYVKHAYDPEIHFRSKDVERDVDCFMVGTGYPERQRIMNEVSWEGIDLHLFGNWMYMQSDNSLQRYLKGMLLENSKTADYYRRSKIALNIFRTVMWPDANPKFIEPSLAKSLSPRVYEAMACGSMLLTDWREELDSFPKDSYALWGSAGELEEKMRYYLSHSEERERIAENGYNWIQGETFEKRSKEILVHLGE